MADKSRKYCAAFPCRNMAAAGSSYCIEHKPAPAHKEAEPFYVSVTWRRFRGWYIRKNPLCQECLKGNRIVRAYMVDHIIELKDGGAPLDERNVQALCRTCHGKKTSIEKQKRGAKAYVY